MKRVLHIIAQEPGKTGSGIYLQSIVKEAGKKGYKQGIVAGFNKKVNLDVENMQHVKLYPVFFETEDIPFSIVGMSDVMPYRSTKYSDLSEDMLKKWEEAFSKTILKAFEEIKPDFIISHHLWLLTALVKKILPDVPILAICHGTDIRQMSLATKYADYAVKGLKNVEAVIALNEYQKEIVTKIYGISKNKINIIGGGYNSDIFYASHKNKKDKIIKLIYAGKLSFSKGVPSLIKSVSLLDSSKINVELIIAGSGKGEEEEAIKQLASRSDVKIAFTGMLTQRKLAEILRDSDIFILPSFYEGLPLVLIEALACGLLTVTTDLPGIKSWLGDIVNNSGIIEYVKLPKMIAADVPYQEDLPDFELRLKTAIEKQINIVTREELKDYDEAIKFINKMSWESIFEGIEESIKKF